MYGLLPKDLPSDDGSLSWLYIDINSFFASVEQQLEPRLRSRPIAVIPVETDSTSVIAASYQAKRFGVKTGTRVGDAKKMCPGILFVCGSHERYVEFHHKIFQAVETCAPVSKVCSIDEFAVSLLGREKQAVVAFGLAKRIKQAIYRSVGCEIHCSIGLAPNRLLAKIAADKQKPNGLTFIFKSDLPCSLHSLKLQDIPGIGPRMDRHLRAQGIFSVERLLSLSLREMRAAYGNIWGERMWYWLRGEQAEMPETKTSSISQSHVLSPDFRSHEKAQLVAQKLVHKAAARMRRKGFVAKNLFLHVRYIGGGKSFSESVKLDNCSEPELLYSLGYLWRKTPKHSCPLQLGIALQGLFRMEEQTLSLFRNPRHDQLTHALDKVQERFGRNSLHFASNLGLSKVARSKIAFTNIPDVAFEDGEDE